MRHAYMAHVHKLVDAENDGDADGAEAGDWEALD
jgi:hypothetical protein